MKHLKYLSYILRHKWYVSVACRERGFIAAGIFHDMSKFLPSEFFPYAQHFYGKEEKNCYNCVHQIWASQCDTTGSGIGQGEQASKCIDYSTKEFDFAWLLHQKRNRHHWQWWILPEDDGDFKILEMQDRYIQEMYCDWVGANLAQGHGGRVGVVEWYQAHKDKMQLGSNTRKKIEELVYQGL